MARLASTPPEASFWPEDGKHGGNPLLHEAVLVGPDEVGLLGRGIRADGQAERRRRRADVLLEAAVLGAERDHVVRRPPARQKVAVDVGDDRGDRHRGMVSEVVRAEQALLLGRDSQEEDRARRPPRERREGPGDLDEAGDSGRVVDRAVVDVVSLDRGPPADVVHVRRVDDVLLRALGVRAAQDADDVLGRQAADRGARLERRPQAEGERLELVLLAEGDERLERLLPLRPRSMRAKASGVICATGTGLPEAARSASSQYIASCVWAFLTRFSHGYDTSDSGVATITTAPAPRPASSAALRCVSPYTALAVFGK